MNHLVKHTLDNGLKVIIIPNEKSGIVSLNLAYKVGSKNEMPGKTGIAHLFEHLMFEGSKNVKKGEFDKLCTTAGGTNNAYTSYDMTAYTMTLPAHQLELGLWLESDRMLEFSVTEEAMVTQQNVVTEEIRQTVFDQPYGKWREFLAKEAFNSACPYSWEVHGSIEDVQGCNLGILGNFYNMYYQPNNACLAVCGNVDPRHTIKLIEKYFGTIQNKNNKKEYLTFSDDQKNKQKVYTFNDSVPLPAVFLNFHCPGFIDDKILLADVIANILANGRSSRMYKSLISDKQIASTVGGYVDKREYGSLITFYGIASDENISIDTLSGELFNSINSIKSDILESEFHKTINQLTTQLAYELQYSSGIADNAASLTLFWNEPERIYTIMDKYKKIELESLYNFASETMTLENSIVINALPEEN